MRDWFKDVIRAVVTVAQGMYVTLWYFFQTYKGRRQLGSYALNGTWTHYFEFPERPGALMTFLNSMSRGWNISLFHYRNHGADYGRVLVGMQVPASDKAEFRAFLARLGYDHVDETGNPAYRMFLGR